MTSVALINLQQADNKSLHDFLGRFSQIAVRIQDLELRVALHSMITTPKSGALAESLCKKRSANMDKLRHRVVGFIQIEELSEFCDKVRRD